MIECNLCGKKITQDEKVLYTDKKEIICSDCFEEIKITIYTCDGEEIANEHNSKIINGTTKLKKELEDDIEFYKKMISEMREKDTVLWFEKRKEIVENLYKNICEGE